MKLPAGIALRFVSYDREKAAGWEELISPAEREQLRRFRSEKRRKEFLAGRVAVRTLLSERLDVPPAEVPIQVAADGAPEVVHHPLHISISHAAGRAVAAVAPCPVGIDLERIVPRRPDLYRFILRPEEYCLLKSLAPDANMAQLLCWALKEAVLKGMRTGFRLSPKKLRLEVHAGQRAAVIFAEGYGEWHVRYEEIDACYLAVAYQVAKEHSANGLGPVA